MVEEFGATHVATISVDAVTMQSFVSFAKAILLIEQFGISRLQELLVEENVLHTILPTPLECVEYPSCFTVFSPFAFTLPLVRHSAVWHFWREGGWRFPHAAAESVLFQFRGSSSPRSGSNTFFVMDALGAIPACEVWSWLSMIVFGLNQLLAWVNDLRTHAASDGEVKVLRQIQAMSSLRLIFSDLRAMNYSVSSHNRATFSYAIIDKLANSRAEFCSRSGKDPLATEGLASIAQWRWLRGCFEGAPSARRP
jgi:hypothetical protein